MAELGGAKWKPGCKPMSHQQELLYDPMLGKSRTSYGLPTDDADQSNCINNGIHQSEATMTATATPTPKSVRFEANPILSVS